MTVSSEPRGRKPMRQVRLNEPIVDAERDYIAAKVRAYAASLSNGDPRLFVEALVQAAGEGIGQAGGEGWLRDEGEGGPLDQMVTELAAMMRLIALGEARGRRSVTSRSMRH
jgi:hypothetical protein